MIRWLKRSKSAYLIAMFIVFMVALCYPVSGAEKPKISVMIWVVTGNDPIWEGIVNDFNAQYGHQIEVEYLPTDNATYNQKLAAMRAGGVEPDVFMVRFDNFPTDALAGNLLDITKYVEADAQIQRALIPQERASAVIDGKWYGLAFKIAFAHAWWNKDLFAAAGIPPMPISGDQAWEWREFTEILKKLTRFDANGNVTQYGLAFDIHWLRAGSVLKTWGVDFVKSDGFDVSSPRAIEAVLGMKSIFDQGLGWYLGSARTRFVERRAAILFDIDTDPHKALSNNYEDWSWYSVAAFPAGLDRTKSSSYMFGENMAISAKTKYPDAAYTFLSFAMQRMWNLKGEVPFLYQFRQLHPDEKALAQQYAFTHCAPIPPFVGFEVQGTLGIASAWNRIIAGTMPVTQLHDLQQQIDQAIAELRSRFQK